MKTFALDNIIFKTGEVIVHKNLNYTAEIKELYKNGDAMVIVPMTAENSAFWTKLPMTFRAKNIAKHFKKQVL